MGFNGRVRGTIAHLKVLNSEKKSEERGKRGLLDGGGKRTLSLLNLPPTNAWTGVLLRIAHYGWKWCIPI